MLESVRILLLADTHIGFDLPARPRIVRRRRGHDFLANYDRALAIAHEGKVDMVVHGGDVFHRSRIPASTAWQGLDPLVRVADKGIPVFVVPGNHERSRLPHSPLARHQGIHVFDRPRTFVKEVRGCRIALAGFPFVRGDIRSQFRDVLAATEWHNMPSDIRLLCLHQCVEGAIVGPATFTFTTGPDVIRARDLPHDLAAVLSGHIHRQQVLKRDLAGRPLKTPVAYPGSIERTSIAEKDEAKGFMIVEVVPSGPPRFEFRPLPARPMMVRELPVDGLGERELEMQLRNLLASLPSDAVLRLLVSGEPVGEARRMVSAEFLRDIAPTTMNVDVMTADGIRASRRKRSRARKETLELPFPSSPWDHPPQG